MTTAEPQSSPSILRNARYRRILSFFGGMILHVIWWDLLLAQLPLLGGRARRARPERLQRWSRRFRLLAVEMGGVMIKLGQFLSSRVDVLPAEVTNELKGLQDEVPPVPWPQIRAVLRVELGSMRDRFAAIEETPVAAASLGQAHRAWLLPEPDTTAERGASVIVKVQRPGIEDLVRVDLAALDVVAHWLMRYRPIGRRANVPALMQEFAETLWEELDYRSEADNAERFKRIHADDPRIYIPNVYREHSTGRVVVLEDVESLKIADVDALKAADIHTPAVADCLLNAYFRQVFTEGFFHADPHPGNLFVRPLDVAPALPAAPGDEPPAAAQEDVGRPFQLIFVDFGMVGVVPGLISENLSKVVISVTQRDARRLTEAFQDLGFFLPGADLDRIAEAVSTVLDQVWGRNLLDLAQPDPREVQELSREFRDVLFDFPFQVPQDFIYLGRAISMVSGLVSQLDPEINPWYQIEKYGEELIRSRSAAVLSELSVETLLEALQPYLGLPSRLLRIVELAESGRFTVQEQPSRGTIRHQERLEKRMRQLGWSILGAAGMLSATLLYLSRKKDDA